MNRRQFSSGLLGAAGALGLNRLAKGAQPTQANNECPTSIRFNFAGLLVFHPSNGIFEMGVLRARPSHILQISIKPKNGDPSRPIKPDLIESYVQGSDRWSLDVKDQAGTALTGVQAVTQIPADRHAPPMPPAPPAIRPLLDLGWMVNIESGEFHGGKINRLTKKLKPIIKLNYGKMGTYCLTPSVNVIKGTNTLRDDFGFIAGATSLCIDISAGQTVVLKTEKVPDILGLKPGVSYDIDIDNAPLQGSSPTGDHFHLYYDLLFTGIGARERFSFKAYKPKPHEPSSDPPFSLLCHLTKEPEPYKCGGIIVNEGSGPLG